MAKTLKLEMDDKVVFMRPAPDWQPPKKRKMKGKH